ncbi:MAG: bifunctional nicotinamidase/pyrazinamidase [Bacteroidales bacterium]
MKTLLIVDVQNDFMQGGALEVPDADSIVPVINDMQNKFDLVVATQDWHPPSHKSFATNHPDKEPLTKITWKGIEQMLWPDHCVQGTSGADFFPLLNTTPVETIFRKGIDEDYDSYSGFYDNGHKKDTGLAGYLKARGVKDLYVCGLAADVCVYYTLLDAVDSGFSVTLILDGTKALDKGNFSEQQKQLKQKGVAFKKSTELF